MASFLVAKRYREKINPTQGCLPDKDVEIIKAEVSKKATKELKQRIVKGYEGIDLNRVENVLEELLRELMVED